MRPLLTWVGVACVALGLSCGARAQTPAAPRLVLSQDSWDFGEVWHPESPALALVVRNEGTADLKIESVQSSCGCTVAQPGRTLVPPGETTDIKVRFDTQGKQDRVTSKVTIISNDPVRPAVEFDVQGFVKRAIRRIPLGGLVVRSIETKPGLTGTARLENQTDEPMHLRLLSTNLPDLEIQIRELQAGVIYEIVGTTKRAFEPGSKVRGSLIFATGLSKEEKLTLYARIEVLSLVEPSPPVIYLDAQTNKEPSERWVDLQYYGTGQFQVTGATCKDPQIKVSLGSTEKPAYAFSLLKPPMTAQTRAKVSLPPVSALPADGVVIEFTTNEPTRPKVEVLVTTSQAMWEVKLKGPPEGPQKPAS